MDSAIIEPKFGKRSELVRYIDEVHRLKDNRPSIGAFLQARSSDPDNDHLSVNSLEVESMKEIAAYHQWLWQSSQGPVALCIHKVHQYSEAGKRSGVQIAYDRQSSKWEFSTGEKQEEAYKHRPVRSVATHPRASPSHCGVEFVRILAEHGALKFARRLCTGRFQLYTLNSNTRQHRR